MTFWREDVGYLIIRFLKKILRDKIFNISESAQPRIKTHLRRSKIRSQMPGNEVPGGVLICFKTFWREDAGYLIIRFLKKISEINVFIFLSLPNHGL